MPKLGDPTGGDSAMSSERNGVSTSGLLHIEQGFDAVGRLDSQELPREHDPGVKLPGQESEIGEDGGEHPAEHNRSRRGWGRLR